MIEVFRHDPTLYVDFPTLVSGALVVGGVGGLDPHVLDPEAGEVVFRDAFGWAHSRRWTHRQSGRSAVRPSTRRGLLVAEALHDGAEAGVAEILATLRAALERAGGEVTAVEQRA